MNTLHEDEFWRISYHPERNYVKTEWKGKMLSTQVFEEKTSLIIKFVEEYKPKSFFADASKFNYPISPEKQDWHNSLLFPIYQKIGLKKMAIIVPEDIFSKVSVQQAYDLDEIGFVTQFFQSEEDALQWLV